LGVARLEAVDALGEVAGDEVVVEARGQIVRHGRHRAPRIERRSGNVVAGQDTDRFLADQTEAS
jgi:hypothetical protein